MPNTYEFVAPQGMKPMIATMNGNTVRSIETFCEKLDVKNMTPALPSVMTDMFPGGNILPIIDFEKKLTCNPTYLSHHSFSIKKLPDSENNHEFMYYVALCYVKEMLNLPAEMFEGKASVAKPGMLCYSENVYDTSIRIWTVKPVSKRLVFNITVAGYKDAVWTSTEVDKVKSVKVKQWE